jgi:drug/metabolite transporter (DMT)-like permease
VSPRSPWLRIVAPSFGVAGAALLVIHAMLEMLSPQQETWAWLIVALVGVVLTAPNLHDAVCACLAAERHQPEFVREADRRIRLDSVRLVGGLAFAVAGVLALLGDYRSWLIALLILGSLCITVNSALDRWQGRRR